MYNIFFFFFNITTFDFNYTHILTKFSRKKHWQVEFTDTRRKNHITQDAAGFFQFLAFQSRDS